MANNQPEKENVTMRAGFFNKDAFRRKERLLLVLTTGVAGLGYYVNTNSDEGKQLFEAQFPGTEILLVRETENAYDNWAIAIYTKNKEQLGYIPRYKNETIARLMDYGKRFVAYVEEPNKDIPEDELQIKARTDTEEEDLQIVVYMVE